MSAASLDAFVVIPKIPLSDISYITKKRAGSSFYPLPARFYFLIKTKVSYAFALFTLLQEE